MSLVVIESLGVAYGAETVFAGLDLRLEQRQRLAVVGANGAGKSTLLRVLAGEIEPTDGTLERARNLRVAFLPQDAPEPKEATVVEEVMASRSDLVALHHEMSELEQAMSRGADDLERVMERYGEAQHRYQDQGGYELEARAREALGGLGLGDEEQRRHPSELSGGQQRRVELAKLLLQDADLLLIDEPTNHLDLEAIEWLEEFMQGVSTAFVLVSHDRRFLDHVCTGVLEIAHHTCETYPGNYSDYTRLRVERRERRRREWEKQQAHISHQEDFIRRYKAGQRAREARGRQKQLDRLERVAPLQEDRRPKLRFTTAPSSGVVLKATELVAGRDGKALVTLPPTTLAPGERVAVVGANGSGKSTLLMTLAGELPAVSGHVTLGPRTVRRLYRQDLGRGDPALDAPGRTVLEALLASHPIGPERGRTMLGALLFSGDDAAKPVAELSGGERARLLLGVLALEPTNLLLLDEPTNHLDIPAQEVLEAALRGYPGTVVLVSHDRALIDAVATQVWGIEPDGTLLRADGGYAELQRARARRGLHASPAPTPAPAPAARGGGHTPVERRQERAARAGGRARGAEVRKLEAEIAETEAALAAARQRLLDPQTFRDPESGADAGREHDRLEGALAELYERWAQVAG